MLWWLAQDFDCSNQKRPKHWSPLCWIGSEWDQLGKQRRLPYLELWWKVCLGWMWQIQLIKRVPSMTTKSSVPRGWVWGGFRPYGAKSMWAKDMPRVLRPENLSTFTRLTLDPSLFAVLLLGILSLGKKKSLAMKVAGSLQNFPFTNTTQRKLCY